MYLCVLSLHQASLSLGWEGPWGPASLRSRPVWAPLSARLAWVQLRTPRRVQACLVWITKPPVTPVEAVRLKAVIYFLPVAPESTLWIILQVSERGLVACVTVCWGSRGGWSQENKERRGSYGICSVVLEFINLSRQNLSWISLLDTRNTKTLSRCFHVSFMEGWLDLSHSYKEGWSQSLGPNWKIQILDIA